MKNEIEVKLKPCCPIAEFPCYTNVDHFHISHKPRPAIANNILETIGNTPLVRLNSVGKIDGVPCEILAKCEFMNPGGSVKERISLRMIEEAERKGQLHTGDTIIEATSGNTGIGLALACAIKGYECKIALPEKMSLEKCNMLKALGAKVIRTRTSAMFYEKDSHYEISKNIRDQDPEHVHLLDQYSNINNVLAHYDTTAEEIIRDCGDKPPDMIVLTIGTGGSITGISSKIKARYPKCLVVGIDPAGSIIADDKKNVVDERNEKDPCKDVEGIGFQFVPTVFSEKYIDMWVRIYDRESFRMARRLIREEGLFCGGSCGAVVYGAIATLKKLQWGPEKRVVVLLPDSVRNYMTKFLLDDWLVSKGYEEFPTNDLSNEFAEISIKDEPKKCSIRRSLKKPYVFKPDQTIEQVLRIIKEENLEKSVGAGLVIEDGVWGPNSVIIGVIDLKKMTKDLLMNGIKCDSLLTYIMNKEYRMAELNHGEDQILKVLLLEPYCVVKTEEGPYIAHDGDFLVNILKE